MSNQRISVEELKAPGSPFVPAPGVLLDLEGVEISSPRLRLRPATRLYGERIFAEYTPEIARYLMTQPTGRLDDTFAFIDKAAAERAAGADLTLVIVQKDTDEFIGMCGLHSQARSLEPHLGIWIKKGAHGNGYGKEAIEALCTWAGRNLVCPAVRYDVDRANHASQRIPAALGGSIVREERTPRTDGGSLDTLVFHIPLPLKQ